MLEEEQREPDEGDEEAGTRRRRRMRMQLSHNSPQLKFAVGHAPPGWLKDTIHICCLCCFVVGKLPRNSLAKAVTT